MSVKTASFLIGDGVSLVIPGGITSISVLKYVLFIFELSGDIACFLLGPVP